MSDVVRFSFTPVAGPSIENSNLPYLPLNLTYQNRSVQVSALLDTGATVNVLPYSLGVQLGAVWERQSIEMELAGNLAQVNARGLLVSATVSDFAPVRLAFAWAKSDDVPVILGQMNFFQEFDVCFYRSRHVFDVQLKGQTT